MVCYGIFWSGQFSCDYMKKIPERMVGLNFSYHSAIKGSSHKKAPAPCHHTDTQMTVKHEFKILISARWRFVDFSAACLLKLRTFSL